jgi:hypothetical protein
MLEKLRWHITPSLHLPSNGSAASSVGIVPSRWFSYSESFHPDGFRTRTESTSGYNVPIRSWSRSCHQVVLTQINTYWHDSGTND